MADKVSIITDSIACLNKEMVERYDIGIIPHHTGELENGGEPIKLYEYLAAGKPVVTTNIAGIDIFKDIISIVKNKNDFLNSLNFWINKYNKNEIIPNTFKKRINKDFSWQLKADLILEKISSKLKKRYS